MPNAFLPGVVILALAAITAPLTLAADPGASQHKYFSQRHVIGVGVSYQESDAEVRASRQGLPEISIDLDDLGVSDSDTSWALEYRWRFAEKWMLVGLAYTFDESGSRVAQRDFNFDGKEFKAGAALDTSLEVDTYILDVLYQVYRSDNFEVMLGGGIHAIDFEASMQGRAFIENFERESARASSDLLAPLPNLRAQMFYAIDNKWGLGMSMGWLSANYDDYDGSFAYVHARLGYAFADNWAVTLGYQLSQIDLTYEKSSTEEVELEIDFNGPTLLVNYRF